MSMRLRALLRASPRMPREDRHRLRDLMRDVARLPPGDDVMPARLCASLQASYARLHPEGRLGFLSILARQDVDEAAVQRGCKTLLAAADESRGAAASLRARAALREALRPPSQTIVERIAQQPDGLRFLVGLRADLLQAMDSSELTAPPAPASPQHTAAPSPDESAAVSTTASSDVSSDAAAERERWRVLDGSLRRLLGVWFDAGLLELRRLTWERTPSSLLEKIMRYERVHPLDGWGDLRQRTDGPGRRLFAFVHPRMPDEPLVFVQCAMLDRVPTRLAHVLPEGGPADGSGEPHGDDARDVAVFYSISSPFAGLRGVPLGRLLIKQVVATLTSERQPPPHTFVTLSPVPGFRSWLEARLARHDVSHATDADSSGEARALTRLLSALDAAGLTPSDPFETLSSIHQPLDTALDGELAAAREALLSLCARYLCLAKKRRSALDPVAAFHLRNGARLQAVHAGANPSARGLRESAGIMVNYEYREQHLEANHSAYVSGGDVQASASVWTLIGDDHVHEKNRV